MNYPLSWVTGREDFLGSLSRVGVKVYFQRQELFPVAVYVKDRKIRFLKFSKLR